MGVLGLETDTFQRPTDLSDTSDPDVRFARAYLRIRVAIGVTGILLPPVLWFLEGVLLKGDWHLRESLSAYYYSGARDVFVGGLCIIGFLMLTYTTGSTSRADFIFSTLAGIAVLGVALFPTDRPAEVAGEHVCGTVADQLAAGCTVLHQNLGEGVVGGIHKGSAFLFIAFLACLCWAFAASEKDHHTDPGNPHGPFHVRFHRRCAGAIVIAGLWALLGPDMGNLTNLYAGEVAAVWVFGSSWLFKGWDLVKQWREEIAWLP